MPAVRFEESWVPGFRGAVRSSTAEGWSVREHCGGMRLQVRQKGQRMQTIALPFDWAKRSTGDALIRIRNIYSLVADGHTLRSAEDLLQGKAPVMARPWQLAAQRFREQKLLHGNAIKQCTWDKNYGPVVGMAVALLSGPKAPGRPDDLLDLCIRDWRPGSRARQIRAQSLSQFLRHCVNRENFPDLWIPPADLRMHVGARPSGGGISQKGDPLTDEQTLELLAGLPDDPSGQRWADAVRLCSELGLRPIELLHLSVRRDPRTRVFHWWCSYRKRSGGGATEPRRLEPLPLIGADGRVQQWSLMERWQAGEIELPPLENGNGAADCLKTYLNRQQSWQTLKREMAERGERLVPYSFRHSYSLRCHQRGIDGGSAAAAMGHSYKCIAAAIPGHQRPVSWLRSSGPVPSSPNVSTGIGSSF